MLEYKKQSTERPKKIIFVTCEELGSNPKTHVKKLAEFLGYPFDNEGQVEELFTSCSVETLRNHDVNKSNNFIHKFPYDSYSRKGQVGDHKNYLTKEEFHGSIFKNEADSS